MILNVKNDAEVSFVHHSRFHCYLWQDEIRQHVKTTTTTTTTTTVTILVTAVKVRAITQQEENQLL